MNKLLISILIALSLIASNYAGSIPDEYKRIAPAVRRNCLKKSGAPLELVERAATGDFAEDHTFKCYIKCAFDRFRLISKKGFAYDAFVKMAPPKYKDTAENIVAKCRDKVENDADLCELSFNVHKCFYNAAPDKYFTM